MPSNVARGQNDSLGVSGLTSNSTRQPITLVTCLYLIVLSTQCMSIKGKHLGHILNPNTSTGWLSSLPLPLPGRSCRACQARRPACSRAAPKAVRCSAQSQQQRQQVVSSIPANPSSLQGLGVSGSCDLLYLKS